MTTDPATGRVTSANNRGIIYNYSYADAGAVRTTTVTDPTGGSRTYVGDSATSLLQSVRDELQRTTSYAYDTNGRLTQVTHPEGNSERYSYDGRGNVSQTTSNPKAGSGLTSVSTSADFDAACSNAKTCNQPNWVRDAKGNQTDFTYDAAHGGVLTVTAPAAADGIRPQTRNSYAQIGGNFPFYVLTGTSVCRTSASCAGGADEVKTTIAYGTAAENYLPTAASSGAGDGSLTATTAFGYDNVGNRITVDGPLPGADDTTRYRFDDKRRLVGIVSADPDGAGPLPSRAARATYNADWLPTLVEQGTVASQSDADWNAFTAQLQAATSYDANTFKQSEALQAGGTTYALTQYSYDAKGRPDCVALRMNSANFGAPPAACTLPFGAIASQYDLAGRRTRVTWPDGLYIGYDYLVTGEMSAVRENGAASGQGVLASFAYDGLGRRTSLTRGNGVVTSYAFDAVSRLASLAHSFGDATKNVSTTFTYNPGSGIASLSRDNDAYAWGGHYNVDRSYGVNGLNQLTSAGSAALGYDGRGNLTSDGSTTYAYTSDNLLKSAVGAHNATLGYDVLGRLMEYDSSGTTRFVYDGGQIASELNGANAVQRRYVWGPSPDEALLWYEGAGTGDRRWLVQDERNSVVAVSNGSGGTIALNSYDEYGNPAASNLGRLQYTGQAWLPELGLSYYKARMYAPSLGRFMQTDPVGYGDGLNWYAYVGNDPLNWTDPSGLCKAGVRPNTCVTPVNPPPTEEQISEIIVTGHRNQLTFPDIPDLPNNFYGPDLSRYLDFSSGGAGGTTTNTSEQKNIPAKRRTPQYCSAKVKLGIVLDVGGTLASAIPGTGQALVLTQLGLTAASAIYSGITHNNQGLAAAGGAYGLTTGGLLAAGKIAERGIPVVGALLGAAQTASDIKNAQEDYENCLRGE